MMDPEKQPSIHVPEQQSSNLSEELEQIARENAEKNRAETEAGSFERSLGDFYNQLEARQANPRDDQIAELSGEENETLYFGRVKLDLQPLLASPKIAADLLDLRDTHKDGRASQEVVRELAEAFKNDQYSESQERDPIGISIVRLENGGHSYILDGGRHRLVAAALAGRKEIEADLTIRQGYCSEDIKAYFKDRQIHSDRAEKQRSNLKEHNPRVIIA